MLKLILSHDHDLENPCDYDGWQLHSFCRRHASFKPPDDLGLGSIDPSTGLPKVNNPGLRSKLKHGLAFFLSYFEHGNCLWFLNGQEPCGVEFQWDGVRVAGLLVWEGKPGDLGPKTFDGRQKDAAGFLKSYTSWCNGDGYGYSIENESGDLIDSCYGFYDPDHMFDEIRPHLLDHEYEIDGEASWLAEYHLTK